MDLNGILKKRKPAILKQWAEVVHSSYPDDSSRFFKKELDPFKNPVGHSITHDLGAIFESLLDGFDAEAIAPHLNYFVKIRSVQDFTPSQAVDFVYQLKKVLGTCLADELQANGSGEHGGLAEELRAFDACLDRVALMAFDSYMENREKLFELRTKQIQRGPLKFVRQPPQALDLENHEEDRKDGET